MDLKRLRDDGKATDVTDDEIFEAVVLEEGVREAHRLWKKGDITADAFAMYIGVILKEDA